MNSKNRNLEGQCALTDKIGPFVKSHIIPQAFTRPSEKGSPLYQSTRGRGGQRRWSSWYDQKLVVRQGEDILSDIDDKAIKALRKYQLVWSGWTVFRPYFNNIQISMPHHGFRRLKIDDPAVIIRFALSIAWRASASSLPDMKDATVDSDTQEKLKNIVLGEKIEGPSPFPVSLIQISTLGEIHNQSPYVDFKPIINLDGKSSNKSEKIMRIYLDGLIFHVHLSSISDERLKDNFIFLGASDEAFITSVSYEASFQYENLLHVMRESFL